MLQTTNHDAGRDAHALSEGPDLFEFRAVRADQDLPFLGQWKQEVYGEAVGFGLLLFVQPVAPFQEDLPLAVK